MNKTWPYLHPAWTQDFPKVLRKNKDEKKDTFVRKKRNKHLKGIFTMIRRNELKKVGSSERFNFHWLNSIHFEMNSTIVKWYLDQAFIFCSTDNLCCQICVRFLISLPYSVGSHELHARQGIWKKIPVTNQNYHQNEGQGHHQAILTWWPEHVLAWY